MKDKNTAGQQLLNWFDFKNDTKVVQIAPEDGALLELIAQKCAQVTLIKPHGDIPKLPPKFKNVQIVPSYNGLKNDFDYAISVSENAPVNPDFLKLVGSLLKPNGTLILGIDNKFGIRYWNGAASNQNSDPFNTIQDFRYHKTNSMAKNEIEALLSQTGFKNLKFYYPMPNLKQPNEIYSDDYLPTLSRLISAHSAGAGYENNQLFSNVLAFRSAVRSEQFSAFANSYLIVARKSQ